MHKDGNHAVQERGQSAWSSKYDIRGWSGSTMVLGKPPRPGVLLIWIRVGHGPTALAVGAGGGCLDIFSPVYHFSLLSLSLWKTARYRLKYCLKGPLSPKQPTNQIRYSPFRGCRKFDFFRFFYPLGQKICIQCALNWKKWYYGDGR